MKKAPTTIAKPGMKPTSTASKPPLSKPTVTKPVTTKPQLTTKSAILKPNTNSTLKPQIRPGSKPPLLKPGLNKTTTTKPLTRVASPPNRTQTQSPKVDIEKELKEERDKLKKLESELESERKRIQELESLKEIEREKLLINDREEQRKKMNELEEEKEKLKILEKERDEEKDNLQREKEKIRAIEKLREQERLKQLEEDNERKHKLEEARRLEEEKIIAEEIRKAEEREREIIREIERARQREMLREKEFIKAIEREQDIDREIAEIKRKREDNDIFKLFAKEREIEDEVHKVIERNMNNTNLSNKKYISKGYNDYLSLSQSAKDFFPVNTRLKTEVEEIIENNIEEEKGVKLNIDEIENDEEIIMIENKKEINNKFDIESQHEEEVKENDDNNIIEQAISKEASIKELNQHSFIEEQNDSKLINNDILIENENKIVAVEEEEKEKHTILNNELIDSLNHKDINSRITKLTHITNFKKFITKQKSNENQIILTNSLIKLNKDSALLSSNPYNSASNFNQETQEQIAGLYNINLKGKIIYDKKALLHKDEIINTLEQSLNNKNKEINLLEEIISDIKSDNIQINKSKAYLITQLNEKNDELLVINEEKDLLERKLKYLRTKNNNLFNDLNSSEQARTDLEETLNSKRNYIKSLEEEKLRLINESDEQRILLENFKLENISNKNENLKKSEKISILQQRIFDLEQDSFDLRSKSNNELQPLKDAKSHFETLKSSFYELKNQYELLNIKFQSLNEENFNIKKEMFLQGNEMKFKDEMIDRLKAELINIRKQMNNQRLKQKQLEFVNYEDEEPIKKSSIKEKERVNRFQKEEVKESSQPLIKKLLRNSSNSNSKNKNKKENKNFSSFKEKPMISVEKQNTNFYDTLDSTFGIKFSETMSNFKPIDKINIIKRQKIEEVQTVLDSLNKIQNQLVGEISRFPEFPKSKQQILKKNETDKELNKVILEIGIAKKQIRELNTINKAF